MAKKILIVRWAGSAYDSLGGLMELAAQELARLGLDVVVLAGDDEDWPQRMLALLQSGEIGFALTMSGIAAEATIDGKLVWEAAQVPLFNWCCDHPCYFPDRHVIRSPYLLHGYVFPDHARYNIAHLKANGAAYAVHLGIPPRSIFAGAPLLGPARNGRVMFAKTGKDTNGIEARWRGSDPELSHIVFAAAEELMHRPTGDFLPVLQRIAEARGLFLAGNSMIALTLIGELDAYIRYRRAEMVVRSVLDQPVDVFGTGWEHIPWDAAQARYHGPLTWREMLGKLPAYSGCLSINPLVDESVHDRVFFALAAGVPPLSDSNAFSRANMPGLERYAFGFTADAIRQAVAAALADPAQAMARTEEAWSALSGPFGLRRSA
ncbi:MAG TPA: hypothetical protein VE690_04785, partial [Rhodopila sp.]|nr:hypothetical protein [Rhodopila sp.]